MAAIDHPQLSHAAAFTDLAYASRPRSHCWKSSESSTISKKSKSVIDSQSEFLLGIYDSVIDGHRDFSDVDATTRDAIHASTSSSR
jgi:hypothetical protein